MLVPAQGVTELGVTKALAFKLGAIEQPDHLRNECIPLGGEGLDLTLD